MHDMVIRGGTIVDGSGDTPFAGDVAIDGDRITAVGVVTAPGREEIDASGRLVTPGFVDIHTHYDGQATWGPRAPPVELARRHVDRHGQLWCRLRAGQTRPARLADRPDGRCRGHSRHRARRGHDVGLGELSRISRRARGAAADDRHRDAGAARRGARVRHGRARRGERGGDAGRRRGDGGDRRGRAHRRRARLHDEPHRPPPGDRRQTSSRAPTPTAPSCSASARASRAPATACSRWRPTSTRAAPSSRG